MNDILDLDGWTVLSKKLVADELEIEAEYTVQPDACQKCGVIGRLYKHGTKEATYRDSPIRGASVLLRAQVKRYKCRDCGGTFLQPLTGMHAEMRMTDRCADFIGRQSLLDTFARIAQEVGCDDKTVRTLARSRIAVLDAGYLPQLPEFMGLDETQIDGKMRMVITDIGRRRPIEMLPERDKATLTTWFNHFRDRSMVKGIAIDMWRPYLDVSKLMFPGVPVVIDKFHVVRMANYCMERVRIRLGKTQPKGQRREWMRTRALLNKRPASLSEKQRFALAMWMDNDAEMAAAYVAKEAFYAIYDMPKAEAALAYDAYASTIPESIRRDFKVLLTAMKNWRTEILAYFDHQISNGYTEALNGVAKTINRQGRGYSFEVLRARLLFRTPGAKRLGLPTSPIRPHAGPGFPDPEKVGRCESCHGLYDTRTLEVFDMPPAVAGQHRKPALTCRTCRGRFHTE